MAGPDRNEVLVTAEELPLGALASRVVCPTAGAIATFIGTTRDHFEGKSVLRLEYEAYQPMAEREILAIIHRARERWSLRHVAISHRVGVVPIAESSVEIAISSEHRREALAAVQFAIDELKARVPIWKKEVYGGDSAAKWKENAEAVTSQLSTSKALKRVSRALPLASITITMLTAAYVVQAMGRRSSMR